jgi:hypothetical protein
MVRAHPASITGSDLAVTLAYPQLIVKDCHGIDMLTFITVIRTGTGCVTGFQYAPVLTEP